MRRALKDWDGRQLKQFLDRVQYEEGERERVMRKLKEENIEGKEAAEWQEGGEEALCAALSVSPATAREILDKLAAFQQVQKSTYVPFGRKKPIPTELIPLQDEGGGFRPSQALSRSLGMPHEQLATLAGLDSASASASAPPSPPVTLFVSRAIDHQLREGGDPVGAFCFFEVV